MNAMTEPLLFKQGDRENKYGHNDPSAGRYVWLDLASLARSSGRRGGRQ